MDTLKVCSPVSFDTLQVPLVKPGEPIIVNFSEIKSAAED
jgi:hypothetical protein